MRLYLVLLVSLPSLAFGQVNYPKFIEQFDRFNTLDISETQVRNLDLRTLEKIDTATVNLFMPYEYMTRGPYNTHDFLRFYKLGRVQIDDDRELLIYVKAGGAGAVNNFIFGLLLLNDNYCAHFELGGLHSDLGFQRLITSKIIDSEVVVVRQEYVGNGDDTYTLDSTVENRITLLNCN